MHTERGVALLRSILKWRGRGTIIAIVAVALLAGAVAAQQWISGIRAERDALAQELTDSVMAMGTLKVELTAADLEREGWAAFAGAPSPDSAVFLRDSTLAAIVRERDVAVNTVVRLRGQITAVGEGSVRVDTVVVEGGVSVEERSGRTDFPGLGFSDWTLRERMEQRLALTVPLTFVEGERGGSRFVAVRPPMSLREVVTFTDNEHFFGPVEPPVIVCDCDSGHHWLWDVAGAGLSFGAGWLINGGRKDVVVELIR